MITNRNVVIIAVIPLVYIDLTAPMRILKPKVSLRLLLLCFIVICTWTGWYSYRARAQQDAVKNISRLGGDIFYSYHSANGSIDRNAKLPGPSYIRKWLGIDYVDHVTCVSFTNVEIEKIPELSNLPRLEALLLFDQPVTDLSPVNGLSNLFTIWIKGTEISDLKPLRSCENLHWINIQETDVTDLSPLFDLPHLNRLLLSTYKFDVEHIDEFRRNQPNCKIITENAG